MDMVSSATVVGGYAAALAVIVGAIRVMLWGAFSSFELRLLDKFDGRYADSKSFELLQNEVARIKRMGE